MSTLDDFSTAQELDRIIEIKVAAQLNKKRPAPRYAIVKEINAEEKYAMVSYVGEDSVVKITYGSIAPENVGDAVRIEGIPGDRYISDVLGDTKLMALANAANDLAGEAKDAADDAQGTAENTGTVVSGIKNSFNSSRPLWWSGDPTVDSSFSWERLAQNIGTGMNTASLSSNLARIACIRFFFDGPRQNIQFMAGRSGTVNSFYFDIYKKVSPDGTDDNMSWDLIYSSSNIAPELTEAIAPFKKILPTALPLASGDVCLVQFRADGTVNLPSTQFPPMQFDTEPRMIGAFRNPGDSYGAAPSSFPKSFIDACFTVITPWVAMGTSATLEPRSWFTNFNSLSWDGWVRRSTNNNQLQIVSPGIVQYGGTTDGWQRAQYGNVVNTDKWLVQARFENPKFVESRLAAGIDTNGNGGVILAVRDSTFRMYDKNGNTVASENGRFGAGDYALSYDPATNKYTGFVNQLPYLEWEDTGNIQPHGPAYRFAGIAINHGFFNDGSRIDNFWWKDVP